jgi:hypothetical protein
MDKKKKKRMIIIITGIIFFSLIAVIVTKVIIEKLKEKRVLELYWEEGEATLDIGERRIIRWNSNREESVIVAAQETAVRILRVEGREVLIEAVRGGYDVITAEAGGKEIVCVVTVKGEIFKFEEERAELPAGVSAEYGIVAEPEYLLEAAKIVYYVEDKTVLAIKRVDDKFIEVLGLKKGSSFIRAEWRNRSAEIMIEVIDEAYRNIIVPKGKQYIFVGQETTAGAGLEDIERGDEYNFKFDLEPGKGKLSITWEKNILKVKALGEGEQYVRVRHPKARGFGYIYYDVLPQPEKQAPRIETSESPMILRKGERRNLELYLLHWEGGAQGSFTYRVIENDYAVKTRQEGSGISVYGEAPGAAKLRIKNSLLQAEYDVMVIVE